MICQRCQKASATVHIDEVTAFKGAGHADNQVEEHHLCETCAQSAQLPHTHASKAVGELWQLMKGKVGTPRPQLTCEGCGLGLDELRRKGRVGCETCYTTFADYLGQLLERMHGATDHVGRLPGVDAVQAERVRALESAKTDLEAAIAAEDFERAAELRDRLLELESTLRVDAGRQDSPSGSASGGGEDTLESGAGA
ncbi:MAG: UvrB/UvrC motif-containing protein [Planctomycetota bacterium]